MPIISYIHTWRGKTSSSARIVRAESVKVYPIIAIGWNISARVTITPVDKPLPFPLSRLRGLIPMCFSCPLPPLIPVFATLCLISEQHHERRQEPYQPSHLYLAVHPFSSVPYPIHPIAQSSPHNCFLYPGFYRPYPFTYPYASDAVFVTARLTLLLVAPSQSSQRSNSSQSV
ncbi:hypothetical protein CNBG_10082 [Cryptococcus deuterogattii R265]|uniref:uncharacterized protein n=1 Tax=Cryptococcus deuterogattii (strain R265) TaxID=294750 RepID=UPI001934C517|nr:hypothetical protein CNBG_10082 [Cryptococcus deuterogattii R265]